MKPVIRKKGEAVDNLLRRFKRQVNRDGIIGEYKKRTAYMKPSERRREKHQAAVGRTARNR